jgi:hypothetical protein
MIGFCDSVSMAFRCAVLLADRGGRVHRRAQNIGARWATRKIPGVDLDAAQQTLRTIGAARDDEPEC